MTVDSLETWNTRAFAVRCTPEQRLAIATLCREGQARGDEHFSVWHMAAKYFGYQDRCNCRPCQLAREKV